MVVQHNLTAMNSNRMLSITTSAQAKSTEKLSSGYKINRAADNAAGLSISEKMRKQIRGLTQATSNAQDGISTVQTAEGALGEVQDMLQRMNELAVQSANGTNSSVDRSAIQAEVNQLTSEIDRVSTTTKFNETYLLKGNAAGKLGAATTVTMYGEAANLAAGASVSAGDYALGTVGIATPAQTGTVVAALGDDTTKLASILNQAQDGNISFTATVAGGVTTWSLTAETGVAGKTYSSTDFAALGVNVTTAAADGDTLTFSKNLTQSATQTATLREQGITDYDPTAVTAANLAKINVGNNLLTTISVDNSGAATVGEYAPTSLPAALNLNFHVGADSYSTNKISVSIDAMSAKGLGVKDSTGAAIDMSTEDNATKSIDTIAAALQKVSNQRSSLGAIQNRLEHTIKNLSNVTENTTSAESSIRDTDMATEMVKYSNNNILSQAGQSMLAQANQSNQGVLTLLKG